MPSIEVVEVPNPSQSKEFIELPWFVYPENSPWVPPLRLQVKDLLNTSKHPFYKTNELKTWLAKDAKGKAVGRLAAVFPKTGIKTAKFGFFEAFDDLETSQKLFEAAFTEAKRRGFEKIEGPLSPSTNYECALLIDGFDRSPTVIMPYNPPYYAKHIENAGFQKAKDLLAFELKPHSPFSQKLFRRAEKSAQNPDIKIRTVDMSKFDEELKTILDIYNDAWEENWGFERISAEEVTLFANEMKPIIDPDLVLIAEVKGKPAGFTLALPDFNPAIKKLKNGKLTPINIAKLLWNMKGPGRKDTIKGVRIVTLGVTQEFRKLPIAAPMYLHILKHGVAKGYTYGEASWILEDNGPMIAGLRLMGAEQTKRYRLYERRL